MWKSFSDRMRLQKADFKESSEALSNPGCGWYHVYYFSILEAEQERLEDTLDKTIILYEEETLVLAMIDLGVFQTCEISSGGLSHITSILDFFRKKGKQVILRFTYDLTGHGLEKEPASVGLIKRHMEQLQPVIIRNADNILVMQGIFVGNWGEMHGSKFLTERFITELITTLYQLTKGSCCLAVRTPAQWRTVMDRKETKKILQGRLALFNDGIFGSPTDLGTYGEGSREEAGEHGKWSRKEELAWQEAYMDSVPNGGEVLADNQPVSFRQAAEDLKRMHVSYLNSAYQQEQLAFWRQEKVEKQGCWKGLSGYEYIGRHLGYRFVIRNLKVTSDKQLEITVENCGFASLCERAECFLLIEENNGQTYRVSLDTDAREWKSGEKTVLQAGFPHLGEIKGDGAFFLELRRKCDGRSLRFANIEAGERVLLGRFRKK